MPIFRPEVPLIFVLNMVIVVWMASCHRKNPPDVPTMNQKKWENIAPPVVPKKVP